MTKPPRKPKRPIGAIIRSVGPTVVLAAAATIVAYLYVDPAPPKKLIISTSDGEGDYLTYAKQYKELMKEDGVELEIRPSSGAMENLKRLTDPNGDVEVGFVPDGLGSAEAAPDLSSIGSLYYEPIWVFYRGTVPVTRFTQLAGKRIAVGQPGGGTEVIATQLLKESGVDRTNSKFSNVGWEKAVTALRSGEVDAAVFMATTDEPVIKTLIADKTLHLMDMDQAEAITRQIPFLHHLVLPHGAMDLKHNLPDRDVHLVSPTATLLVRDSVHPALIYLLLKAASQIHDDPGIFEKKNEFPIDKNYGFPLAAEAKTYYKSGTPFWRRYLPFWLATLIERFILIVIPLLAVLLPLFRLIPRYLNWRVRSKIYRRYGELKFLETQMKPDAGPAKHLEFLTKLDAIEDGVNQMKVPLDFADHIYVLRQHIDFVRERLRRLTAPT